MADGQRLFLRGWDHVEAIVPFFAVGLLVIGWHSRELNLFFLGERHAAHLGVSVGRMRVLLLVTASLVAGAAVSVSGTIGFVGLVVPHVMRMLFGPDHRLLLPVSALAGAMFLVGSDMLARCARPPGIARRRDHRLCRGPPSSGGCFGKAALPKGHEGRGRDGSGRSGRKLQEDRFQEMEGGVGMLRAKGLTKRYGGRSALRGVDLQVERGETVGLIGPNGSGKSTLVRLLCGEERPDEGRIYLAGRELSAWSPRERARQMAVLPQEGLPPVPFTVEEVVKMGRHPHMRRPWMSREIGTWWRRF